MTTIYMAMVMIGSLEPGTPAPHNLLKEVLHNLLHVPAYTVLTLLVMMTVDALGRALTRRVVIEAVAIAVLYGSLIEILQGYVPGRTSSFLDVLLNFCGALLAVVVAKSGVISFSKGEPKEGR